MGKTAKITGREQINIKGINQLHDAEPKTNGKPKKIAPHALRESVKIIAEIKAIKRAKGITRFLPKIKGCMTEAKQKGHTPDNHAAVIFA